MDSNAAGQLLGYAIQFPRALYHLLTSKPGDSVCIEVLGDVATIKSNGTVVSEEDKSSVNGNPITDKSTDLWKTLYNWINASNKGEITLENTKFILYTNQEGREGIAYKFSSAHNKEQAQDAITHARDKLGGLDKKHAIWDYYDFVVNKNEVTLIKLIERFEVQIGNGASYDEVDRAFEEKHIPKKQISFYRDNLSGWLQKEILEKIANKQRAIVSWKDFDKQFVVCAERARSRELIDFTLRKTYGKEIVQPHIEARPLYLTQLEEIGLLEDDLIEAVIDYMKAETNRDIWIENEIIDTDVADEFEDRLVKFWMNIRKKILLTNLGRSDEDLGELLLLECKMRQETIRDMNPPASMIAGTYHFLADEPLIGWHPEWEKKFLRKG
jgi:hypothetical protein